MPPQGLELREQFSPKRTHAVSHKEHNGCMQNVKNISFLLQTAELLPSSQAASYYACSLGQVVYPLEFDCHITELKH